MKNTLIKAARRATKRTSASPGRRWGFYLFLLLASLGLAPVTGCAGLTDPFVPAYSAPGVKAYAGVTNGPANGLFWSLKDAKRLALQIEVRHAIDEMEYYSAKGLNDSAITAGSALQDRLFNKDTGYVSLGIAAGLTLLGGGGMSAVTYRAGLKKPRPGDVPVEQHTAEVRAAGLSDPAEFGGAKNA